MPEKLNGFIMKIPQEPPTLKNHCFYNTKDMEQKYFQKNRMALL